MPSLAAQLPSESTRNCSGACPRASLYWLPRRIVRRGREVVVRGFSERVQVIGCLVLAMALWGSSFIALKLAFSELPPLWVIFGRMALGSLVFLLAWRWRGQMRYQAGDWKYLSLIHI